MTDKNDVSLEVAKRLSARVNEEFESGNMLEKVTPTTHDLLNYWFGAYCEQRKVNFHEGQRQAILNIIYLHEVMGVKTVLDTYDNVAPDLLPIIDASIFGKEKYQIPKYAVKMATGTGKTWVMHALLIWQMLNARHEDAPSGRFTKNFLIIAPGLIVYDRLKDAFCGRIERGQETRDIETNDFYRNQELFIPIQYRHEVFSFIQNNVVTKEEGIGRKTTGEGMIALTNWHLFENQLDDVDEDADEDEDTPTPDKIISRLLPVRPGKAAGNDLGMIDNRTLRGAEIEHLASLQDLMVINDEAHHIHELKRNGEIEEVEWQKGLNAIAGNKGDRFMQVDFSATPYDTIGYRKINGKEKPINKFFPHIIVDYDLATAIKNGRVKTLLIDKRKELTDLNGLDFRAERDENGKAVGLSDGQRLMLRAGLTKLNKLEHDFLETDETKNPKMLIMCEDTNVSPYVVDFLKDEGLDDEDIVKIDSSAKGEVKEDEWKKIKTDLFNIDKYKKPKVIVSVLMLREGFDVNNICVIVPLRSSQAPILLEQTIGRGLRLMWREEEYSSLKNEDRKRVLVFKQDPKTYIDMLSIIEHPAFMEFYEDMFKDGLAGVDESDVESKSSVGDIIKVGLKDDFEKYDFEWPVITKDAEDEIASTEIDINDMQPYKLHKLETLRKFLVSDGETFISQEATTKTQFGQYKVTADLFTANNYNEYLQKILRVVTNRFGIGNRKKSMPNIQIDGAGIVGVIDSYIRTKLFEQPFNPFKDNDWKILLAINGIVTQHIVKEVARAIYKMLEKVSVTDAVVEHIKFSSVDTLRMRESYSLELQKVIYERLSYPSHGGGFEKSFMEYLDKDAEVERFLKINETQHLFAVIYYIRNDGLMATYHPDFIVATRDKIYVIETKGNDKIDDKNVRSKQISALDWVKKINGLKAEERMNRTWEYTLLSEDNFYSLASNGATITDICNLCKVSTSSVTGDFFTDML